MIQEGLIVSFAQKLRLKSRLVLELFSTVHFSALLFLILLLPSSAGASFSVLLSSSPVSISDNTHYQYPHETGISIFHQQNDLNCAILLSEQLENDEDEVGLHEKRRLSRGLVYANVSNEEMALRPKVAIQRKRYILFHCLKIPS